MLRAGVTQITKLLSKDFIRLILVSLVMAAPVAWYLQQRWLQHFAYRIDMHIIKKRITSEQQIRERVYAPCSFYSFLKIPAC